MNLKILPLEIENIIINYVYQLIHMEKMKQTIKIINEICPIYYEFADYRMLTFNNNKFNYKFGHTKKIYFCDQCGDYICNYFRKNYIKSIKCNCPNDIDWIM